MSKVYLVPFLSIIHLASYHALSWIQNHRPLIIVQCGAVIVNIQLPACYSGTDSWIAILVKHHTVLVKQSQKFDKKSYPTLTKALTSCITVFESKVGIPRIFSFPTLRSQLAPQRLRFPSDSFTFLCDVNLIENQIQYSSRYSLKLSIINLKLVQYRASRPHLLIYSLPFWIGRFFDIQ